MVTSSRDSILPAPATPRTYRGHRRGNGTGGGISGTPGTRNSGHTGHVGHNSWAHAPRLAIFTGSGNEKTPAFTGDFSIFNDLRHRVSVTFTV